jgi:hypothetical protein
VLNSNSILIHWYSLLVTIYTSKYKTPRDTRQSLRHNTRRYFRSRDMFSETVVNPLHDRYTFSSRDRYNMGPQRPIKGYHVIVKTPKPTS